MDVAKELPRWRLAERISPSAACPGPGSPPNWSAAWSRTCASSPCSAPAGADMKVQLKIKGEARTREAEAAFVESLQKNAFFDQVILEREAERQGGGVDFDYTLAVNSNPPPYQPLPKSAPQAPAKAPGQDIARRAGQGPCRRAGQGRPRPVRPASPCRRLRRVPRPPRRPPAAPEAPANAADLQDAGHGASPAPLPAQQPARQPAQQPARQCGGQPMTTSLRASQFRLVGGCRPGPGRPAHRPLPAARRLRASACRPRRP